MDVRLQPDIKALLSFQKEGPRLSVCQPVNGQFPDISKDILRFRNLFGLFRDSLAEHHHKQTIEKLLAPFAELVADKPFWDHSFKGLAVYGAPGMFRAVRLADPVAERAVFSDMFYLKPLIEQYQTADRYQVLSLSRKSLRLFQGQRQHLDEVQLHPSIPRSVTDVQTDLPEPEAAPKARHGHEGLNEALPTQAAHHRGLGSKDRQDQDTNILDPELIRFFRVVDQRVTERHSKPTGLPLLLAATPEYQGLFRNVSKNPYLLEEPLDVHIGGMSAHEASPPVWNALRPRYEAQWRARSARFAEASAAGFASDLATEIAQAAAEGRVETLLVERDTRAEGQIEPEEELAKPTSRDHREVDTLLDAVAQLALNNGAEVIVVPLEQMPSATGLAAIFRYPNPAIEQARAT
jgi:Bacterial archaeo-eukaryotic release factor family 3